jgi:hypothetical protein
MESLKPVGLNRQQLANAGKAVQQGFSDSGSNPRKGVEIQVRQE